jgi:hypothetical protein
MVTLPTSAMSLFVQTVQAVQAAQAVHPLLSPPAVLPRAGRNRWGPLPYPAGGKSQPLIVTLTFLLTA